MTGTDNSARKGPKLDSEIRLPALVLFVVVLVLIVVVAAVAMYFLSVGMRDRMIAKDPPPAALPEARAPHEPPAPRLQADPIQDMAELRAEEDAELSSYGWVDEAAGVASIPVDRAIALLAEAAAGPDAEPGSAESGDSIPEPATSGPGDAEQGDGQEPGNP